jgi:cyanophycinase
MSLKAPKGKLIPIGGAEKRIDPTEGNMRKLEVLSRVVKEMKGKKTKIEVIPTASSIPKEMAAIYSESFKSLGLTNVGFLNVRSKKDTNRNEVLERIKKADGLMFTGGDQRKIINAFGGTEVHDTLVKRYTEEEDFVIAGTSAGAMAMSEVMIFGGHSRGAMVTGKSKTTHGLALMDKAIIDSHFIQRGRFGRMAVAVLENKNLFGIGLGEDTGVIISEGRYLECIGTGHVLIIDGQKLTEYKPSTKDVFQVSFENMKVHVLCIGSKFDLTKRKFLS